MHTASLLDRYLQSIENLLPSRQRNDIMAELRANLQAEFEDRAETLQRPLTVDEQSVLIRQHGHPVAVAARYFPIPHLIGAPWISLYWLVLRLVLAAALIVTISRIVVGAALLHVSAGWITGVALEFPTLAIILFAWVTLSFAAVDYFGRRYAWSGEFRWDPARLPYIKMSSLEPRPKPLAHLAGAILGLAIVVGVLNLKSFLPVSTMGILLFSPAWHAAYEIFLASAVLGVVAAAAMVFRPDWYRLRPIVGLLSSTLLLFGLGLLLQGAPWVALADPIRASVSYATSVSTANIVIFWAIAGTMIGIGISILVDVWRCITLWRRRGQSVSTSVLLC